VVVAPLPPPRDVPAPLDMAADITHEEHKAKLAATAELIEASS
jgi:hypothetical protein